MRNFAIGVAIAALSALPLRAEPAETSAQVPQAPTQTPAQLDASAGPSPAPQMPSQAEKAEVKQSDKVAANAAASAGGREDDQDKKENSGPVTDQQLAEKAPVDNGANDGGAAAHTVVP